MFSSQGISKRWNQLHRVDLGRSHSHSRAGVDMFGHAHGPWAMGH